MRRSIYDDVAADFDLVDVGVLKRVEHTAALLILADVTVVLSHRSVVLQSRDTKDCTT